MKTISILKTFFCLAFSTLLIALPGIAQITSPSPYCNASYDDASGMVVAHYISNVTFGTLNNTTGTKQFAAPHYAYYNALTAPNLTKGSSYTLSVSHDGMMHFVAVYIDFNIDGDFADVGELVLTQNALVSSTSKITNPSTGTVTIPSSATIGKTRMRVMVFEDDDYTSMVAGSGIVVPVPCTADATGSLDWGETEDYDVNIVGTGGGSSPVANFNSSATTGSTATIFNLTDASTNKPTSWKWTITPATVIYTTGSSTSANPSVKFTANGTYAVKLWVSNAAGKDSITKSSYIQIKSGAGINEVNGVDQIAIFPNPANDMLHINPLFKGYDMQIVDMNGKMVLEYLSLEDLSISVAHLAVGTYFVQFKQEAQVFSQKVQIER